MRIGPKMKLVAAYVAARPGCSMRAAAHYVSPCREPTKNESYGYNTCHRALCAGIVRAEVRNGRYFLFPAAAGEP